MVAAPARAALTLAALGIVFGDIGTSPLYAFKAALAAGATTAQADVLGVVSLFIWAIIVVVAIKYITLVTRASHDGEGGILPLATLAARGAGRASRLTALATLAAVIGVGLFYADGAITPAISILGSSGGLTTVSPSLQRLVVPLALIVIALLFVIQRFGSGWLGRLFGPIMLVWFAVIALLGGWHLAQAPEALRAFNPWIGIAFLVGHPAIALGVIGAVVLCVTGVEVLYADLGHFGRGPIVLGWFAVVMPALLLNYLGQAALLLSDPAAAENPFFSMAPDHLDIPLIVLASVATFIAAQAVISGVFSMTRQASMVEYLPRTRVTHTSPEIEGQIYLPVANVMLFLAVVLFVLIFETADALAGAYGIAVTGGMVISTLLVAVVARRIWGWPRPVVVLALAPLLIIDLALFVSTLTKITHGGWTALLLAFAAFAVIATWRWGSRRVATRIGAESAPMEDIPAVVAGRQRVPGVAVILSSSPTHVSGAIMRYLREGLVAHRQLLLVCVIPSMTPRVPEAERLQFERISDGVIRASVRDGFFEDPNVPAILDAHWAAMGLPGGASEAHYIVGDDGVVLDPRRRGPRRVLARLFAVMHRNEARVEDTFDLPADRVVRLGAEVRI